MILIPLTFTIFMQLAAVAGQDPNHVVGYAVESGDLYTALCFVDNTFTSISGSIAACVSTNEEAATDTSQYSSVVNVWSCAGESALAYTRLVHFPNSIATSINTMQCSRPCSTAKVYQASPSVTPTLHLAVCGGDIADAIGAGLPTDVKTIYHQRPSTGAGNITPPPRTQQTQQPTGTNANGSGNLSSDGVSSSKNKKLPVILGAVFGSLGAIGFAALAYYCGRRRTAKKRRVQPLPSNEPQDKTSELGPTHWRHPELDSSQIVEAPQSGVHPSQIAQLAHPELDSSQIIEAPQSGVYSSQVTQSIHPELPPSQQTRHPQKDPSGWQNASELSGQGRPHELSAHPHPYEQSGSL